jgi:hypothetical protein
MTEAARLDSFISLADVTIGARFLSRLPAFLRHRISPKQARAILRRRFEQREADFLAIAKLGIYQQAQSPYLPLLQLAGCEYGDLERLVRKDGVEEALRVLYRQGVYLTVDEFKGRHPIVRGNVTIAVDSDRFRNPNSRFHLAARSSGSRSRGTPVLLDLAFVGDCAVDTSLFFEGRGGIVWPKAIWGVPGSWGIARVLEFSTFCAPPVRWFSQVDLAEPGLHPRYRWSMRTLRWGGLLAGVPLPRPLYVPPDDPLPIARWMAEIIRGGGNPHLSTFVSSAVRICRAALDAGVELHGAHFTIVGEPLTGARLAVIRQSGATALPHYAIIECGAVSLGCLAPETPDETHLLHDLHAMIQAGPDGTTSGLSPLALLMSSLRPTAPFILLNVSMGDQAVMTRRACGCPLEGFGWATHLHTIRSYEKLTSGGMTFLDTDVIRVLEEVLPARFGGAPTDYQLVEDEADDGSPRLRLLVHPAVGPLDIGAVSETFLNAIGAGAGVERVMSLLWRDAGLLRVERLALRATASGKVLHLHLDRTPPARSASHPEA